MEMVYLEDMSQKATSREGRVSRNVHRDDVDPARCPSRPARDMWVEIKEKMRFER